MLPDNDKSSAKFTRLRREALELLSRQPGLVSSKSGANIKELIHELNVHQTELVIQNEELKQSQRDLAKISREYEDLYELAPCGYITLTAKQTISRINKAALSFLGEKELKLNLSTFGQFIEPGWDDFFHTALKNAAQTGNTQSIDLKLRNKAGLPLWIQMEIEADCDEKGQVLQWRLVFVDISQKIAAETALQESQERFKSLFHNAPIAYQSLDKDGNFIEVNDAWLSILGYARDEVIGQNFGNFLHPDMQDHFKKNFPRFKVVGEILGVEFEMCKKNGSNSIVSFHEKIGKKPNGEFKQTHCVFSDITEQKKAETSAKRLEAQLQQARKLEAIGVLAGGIAHDFNNILFPIMGFSELTLEELPENSPVRENVNAILTGAKRAAELVQQILAFSAPRQKSPEPIIVQSVFKEAISFLRAIIPQNIDIRQEISPTPICIMNDPTQLYEIVMNLCTNAYHAMEEEGGLLSIRVNEVEVGAGRINKGMEMTPGRYCRIDIHDTGSGIPAEHLDKIFDPYFSTKEIGKGSGIGLSVVHGIVKEHNGCIQVKSRPGKTEFTVYFPITDRIKKKDQIRQLFVKSIGNEKILFVDDETAIVEIVTQSLERLGYEVTGKTSSVEALNEFETHPDRFDLIITDMTMPGIIGTNLIKKIREIRPGIPVMLCTGYSHLADAETAKALNINEFIYKPVSINELSAKVRKIFDQTNEPQAINEPDNM